MLDTPQKVFSSEFALRRKAQWQGHFHDERCGKGPWRPIGTLAKEMLLSFPSENGATPSGDVHALPKDAAPLWHSAFDRVTSGESTPQREWGHHVTSWAVAPGFPEYTGRKKRRRPVMVQEFSLEPNPLLHATWLSLLHGLGSYRLWKCKSCEKPFIRFDLQRLNQKNCDECERLEKVRTAAGLSRDFLQRYRKLRIRLAVWHTRDKTEKQKQLQPSLFREWEIKAKKNQKRKQQAALRALRLVTAGNMTIDQWTERYDTYRRPPKRQFAREQPPDIPNKQEVDRALGR